MPPFPLHFFHISKTLTERVLSLEQYPSYTCPEEGPVYDGYSSNETTRSVSSAFPSSALQLVLIPP